MQTGHAMRKDRVAAAGRDELDRHRRVGLWGRERVSLEVGERERLGLGERVVFREHGDGELLP
jgi:hypothetical protein